MNLVSTNFDDNYDYDYDDEKNSLQNMWLSFNLYQHVLKAILLKSFKCQLPLEGRQPATFRE